MFHCHKNWLALPFGEEGGVVTVMFPRGVVVGVELPEEKAFDVGPSRGVEVVGVVAVVGVFKTWGVDGRGHGSGVSIKESSVGFCVLVYSAADTGYPSLIKWREKRQK